MDRRALLDAAAASNGWLDLYLGYYGTSDVTGAGRGVLSVTRAKSIETTQATEYLKLVGLPRPVAGFFTARPSAHHVLDARRGAPRRPCSRAAT